jgi:acylglycerol lipase
MRLLVLRVISGLALTSLAGCVTFDNDPTPSDANDGPGVQVAAVSPGALLPSPEASLSDDRYLTVDGVALPLRQWLPEGPPAAIILALHGFNDYSNAFALPAPDLVAQGIALYAYDQRGFGGAPHRGRWAGGAVMADDAAHAAALLHRRYPGRPLYLLGESMGGAVAILAATRPEPAPVNGVILSAPAVWGRQTMNVFERAGLWLARLVPSMQVSGRTLPIDIRPSDNIAMLRALGADPMVIKNTRSDTLNGLVDLMGAALAAAPHLMLPALVLYGERDEIVPRAPLARLVKALPPAAEQRIALYPSGYHMLLRDLQAKTVLGDVGAWARDRDAALPSGADHAARSSLASEAVNPRVE